MQAFHYYAPTDVYFGRGVEAEVGAVCKHHGIGRVLLLYGGGSVQRSGLLPRIEQALDAAGIIYRAMGGVKANPTVEFAREALDAARNCQAELILAVGGGSVIDTAKAVAIGMAEPQYDIWDFWSQKQPVTKAYPVGVILTIPAAGSEMSDSAVLTNETIGVKVGINTNINRPLFALMNPALAATLPKSQVTNGVVDIIMHTLERYMVKESENALTDTIAEGLLRTVIRYGPRAVEDPSDYDAMSEVMWASSLSHNDLTGLGRPKELVVHKFGHELSARFDSPHGATLSAIWCSWARLTMPAIAHRLARLATEVWGIDSGTEEEKARAAIDRFESFFASVGSPVHLKELVGELSDELLEELAKAVTKGDTVRFGKATIENDQARALEVYKLARG